MGDESIYNLIPREYVPVSKPPMYRSRHDPTAPVTGSTFGTHGTTRPPGAGLLVKREHSVLGPKDVARPDPQNFLKKSLTTPEMVGEMRRSMHSSFRYTDEQRRPAVPSRDDRPVMGLRSNKNFITANAVEAILQVPPATDLGLPNYLRKEDYGRVPTYLQQVREEIRRETDMIDQYVRDQMAEGSGRGEEGVYEEMLESEREALVGALKIKWGDVNKEYQKITHMVKLDSTGKIRRKERLEAELKEIEADIQRLERPGPVMVRIDN